MIEGDVIALAGQQALWTTLLLCGPLLGLILAIGLAVSVVQALTQVQEAALAFVPKMLAVGLAMLFGGPLAMALLRGFTETLFARIASIGGAG
jgi:flagellar biosynthetic protein FliQ